MQRSIAYRATFRYQSPYGFMHILAKCHSKCLVPCAIRPYMILCKSLVIECLIFLELDCGKTFVMWSSQLFVFCAVIDLYFDSLSLRYVYDIFVYCVFAAG